jgi:hypothetical protein
MALGDWVQNKSGSVWTVAIDVGDPMVDSGSLSLQSENGVAGPSGHTFVLGAPFSSGFTKGKIRTLLRWDTGGEINVSNSQRWGVGIVCMMSAADVTVGGGGESCYTWYIGSGNNAATNQMETCLFKHTDGLSTSTSHTTLFEANTPGTYPPAAGAFWPLELEWVADLAGLGGTRLIARVGTQNSTDFGTLVDKIDTIDTTSPLLTSVGEGVVAWQGHTGSRNPGYEWTLDTTSVFELV